MGNTDSPLAGGLLKDPQQNSPTRESYVTQRNSKKMTIENDSISSDNLSNLGDTMQLADTPNNEDRTLDHPLTLRNINELLQSTLQQNNKSIIAELRKIIENEVEEVISVLRKEIKQQAENSKTKEAEMYKEIQNLNSKIELLSQGCKNLQSESLKLKTEFRNNKIDPPRTNTDTPKTVVLHGLPENYWETEEETCERVIHAVYDILNIDLTGYIE